MLVMTLNTLTVGLTLSDPATNNRSAIVSAIHKLIKMAA